MRLIDADDLNLHRELCTYERYTGIDEMPYEYANREIKNAKTVNVNNLIVEEIEKIKAEIKKLAFLFDDLSPDKELVVDLDNIEKVFNEHIAELKGGAE